MSLTAFATVLFAAMLHAGWNALVKGGPDKLLSTVLIASFASVIAAMALPFLTQPARAAVAVVDPDNCSGCRRCLVDCPYAAITMVDHPNQRVGRELALVDADLCIGCGICAGACPSSTPFRRIQQLATGIDMPQLPVDALRARLRQDMGAATASHPLVVFSCEHGAAVDGRQAPDVQTYPLLCTGQLPPSFVEYALRDGAAGVVVATCREGGCAFRLGQRWTAERLAGQREPHLRQHVPAERVELVAAGPGDEPLLSAAIDRLRVRVHGLSDQPRIQNDDYSLQT